MEIIQILLSLFFTYFVLMMNDLNLLLNCSLQKFLKENILVKHFIIFFSIFVFTFVLGWYKFDSLQIDNFTQNTQKPKYVTQNILWHYFKSTLIIYIIFIITTNNEGIFVVIFLVSFLCLTLLQVYTKSIDKNIHKSIHSYNYINKKLKKELGKNITNQADFNKIILCHNISYIWFYLVILILLIGMYKYYLKRKKEYKKDWSWIKFLFGNNYCKGIRY